MMSSAGFAGGRTDKWSPANHTIFRDRPDLAFPAVRNFISQITEGQRAS
jgi:hypothetical protein